MAHSHKTINYLLMEQLYHFLSTMHADSAFAHWGQQNVDKSGMVAPSADS